MLKKKYSLEAEMMCIEPAYEMTFINLYLVRWATSQVNGRKEQNSTKEHRGRQVHTLKQSEESVFYSVLPPTQVARYVWNKADFDAVDPETTDYFMGEFGW